MSLSTSLKLGLFCSSTLLFVALRKLTGGASGKSVQSASKKDQRIVAVNYHFTRQCNFACGFCFHTAKTSHVESLENACRIIKELRIAGAEKINFAGGEPFLPNYKDMLGEMVKYAKVECGYQSVSIISNGHYIKEKFFEKYAAYLDILGMSCDSQHDKVNKQIGRGKGGQADQAIKVANMCRKYGVMFKLNTVVNAYNKDEDMASFVEKVHPMRWKVFQVLPLDGENYGEGAKRDISDFLITNSDFEKFVALHKSKSFIQSSGIMKVEDNSSMQSSYVLVDEYGRFLDSSTGGKIPTKSILEVGVDVAFQQLVSSEGGGYDNEAFYGRDGDYNGRTEWAKSAAASCGDCGGGGGGEPGVIVDLEDLGVPV